MKAVIYDEKTRIPIKIWASELDEATKLQARNLANHPVAFKHIALMADTHLGNGMPIGGVMACKKAIIPNAIGSDCGCSMRAVQTDFIIDRDISSDLKNVINDLSKTIPVGQNWHTTQQPLGENLFVLPDSEIVRREIAHAAYQLGTLGGGNHFIELQKDEDNFLWIMLHSGSRNFGKKIGDYYNKKAVELCERWFSDIPDKNLAFFPFDDPLGKEYYNAMSYTLDFAKENRKRMMNVVKEVVGDYFGCSFYGNLDVQHNYAAWENHFGTNVIVHRKGAIRAREGDIGIIPGSMGTPSYIVKGLGCPDSFNSCSHGAGRKMGRMEATRKLTLEDCNDSMKGIVFLGWGKDRKGDIDLGEAPEAYKDIDEVISNQADLIKPIKKLRPLAVLKG